MLTVNELAKQGQVQAHVVRYYTRLGLIHPERQKENGYRLFTQDDVNRLHFIRLAKQLGFTLNEIKEIIQHADMKESPCQEVRKIIQARIVENRQKIEEMMKLQTRMESALEQWKDMPDGIPNGHSVCHLIESIQEEV
jgi:DNA-binding transcriptional MerR regulator